MPGRSRCARRRARGSRSTWCAGAGRSGCSQHRFHGVLPGPPLPEHERRATVGRASDSNPPTRKPLPLSVLATECSRRAGDVEHAAAPKSLLSGPGRSLEAEGASDGDGRVRTVSLNSVVPLQLRWLGCTVPPVLEQAGVGAPTDQLGRRTKYFGRICHAKRDGIRDRPTSPNAVALGQGTGRQEWQRQNPRVRESSVSRST